MKPCTTDHEFPKFACYDIETPGWGDPRIGGYVRCVCHVDEYQNRKVFRSDEGSKNPISDYVDWLFDEFWFQSDMVWAHWGGKFDHNFVLSECFERGYTFEVVLSGNLMVVITVTNPERRRMKFCESARIMPDSVEEIGKSLDKAHVRAGGTAGTWLKMDADVTDVAAIPWDHLIEYCFRDCDIVLQGLISMREELKPRGIDFAFTLASMATRSIRRSGVVDTNRFYEPDPARPGKQMRDREFTLADAFSYLAYKGGRTEAFAVCNVDEGISEFLGPLYLYDITSCYPAAMQQLDLPTYFEKFDGGCRNSDGSTNFERTFKRCGTTQCYVTIPRGSMPYPLLAFKFTKKQIQEIKDYAVDERGEKLTMTAAQLRDLEHRIVYIEGTDLEGTWTNLELLELWRHMKDVPGFEITIICCAVYEAHAFMRPFVTTFWKLREQAIKNGDAFKKYTHKILLNSASGKLAEQPEKLKVVHGAAVNRARQDYGEQAVTGSSIPGIYLVHHQAEGAFRHAAAASYITAYARIEVWRAMMKAHEAGARVLYCDTDSIIVDKPILGTDCTAKELGKWHLECTIKRMEIWGPKLYMYETDPSDDNPTGEFYKAKGININRREDKGKPEVTRQRWNDFVSFHKGKRTAKISKEGIYGFLTLIGRDGRKNVTQGPDKAKSIHPQAFKLQRASTNKDTKRQHAGGHSKPHYLRPSRHDPKPKPKTRKLVSIPR